MASQQALPSLDTLIKPTQVASIPSIAAEQKHQYYQGIERLWAQIRASPPGSAEHVAAHKKLTDVSRTIKTNLNRWKEQNGQGPGTSAAMATAASAQNGARPLNQGQQGQPGQVGPAGSYGVQGHPQSVPQQGAESNFSPQVLEKVRNMKMFAPPQLWSKPEAEQTAWLRDAKRKYATHLQRFESARQRIQELQLQAQQRQNSGRPLSEQEMQSFNNQRRLYTEQATDASNHLTAFNKQQEQLKQMKDSNLAGATTSMAQNPNRASQPNINASGSQSEHQSGMTADQQGQSNQQPPAASTTLDTAASQENANPNISPQGKALPTQMPNSQHPNPQANTSLSTPSQAPSQLQPALNVNTSATAAPHPTNSQSATVQNSQGPHPLSHKAAMAQAARSYSQSNVPQSTPQSASHAHPQMGGREQQNNNNSKMPIPKHMNIVHQPVTMGPARPTLSGGASTGAMGPMGQPGIQKHPGYVLEGEGERVLSKKKLEELVRQVTGGGDSESGETLDPDVEEVSKIPYS